MLLQTQDEYNAVKGKYPNSLVGFELDGHYLFLGEDAKQVSGILDSKLLEKPLEQGGHSPAVGEGVQVEQGDGAHLRQGGGDQQPVGLGLAGGRRHGAGEFFRDDLKVHVTPPVPPG